MLMPAIFVKDIRNYDTHTTRSLLEREASSNAYYEDFVPQYHPMPQPDRVLKYRQYLLDK